jgi:hypothetical protein
MYFNGKEAYFHDSDTVQTIINHFATLDKSVAYYNHSMKDGTHIDTLENHLNGFTFYSLDEEEQELYQKLIKKEQDYFLHAQSNMMKVKLNSFFALCDYLERRQDVAQAHSFSWKGMVSGEGKEQHLVGWQGEFKGALKNILNNAGHIDTISMFFFQIHDRVKKEELPTLDLTSMQDVVHTIENHFLLSMSRDDFIQQYEDYQYHAKNVTKFKKSF